MNPTYRKRPGTTNKGGEYEILNIASIVLKLVSDKNIKNFYISSNNEEFGAFDDVVVEIELPSSSEVYALQLKHSDRGNLALEKLQNRKGDYSISKYFDSFRSIKNSTAKLVLFTNLKFNVNDHKQIQLEGEDFRIELLKFCPSFTFMTLEKTNCCYVFRVVNGAKFKKNPKVQEYETFFKRFYLLVNQDNFRDLKANMVTEFKKQFSADATEFDKYFKFITEWSMQEGKKEKLDKTWMQRAISLQLLSSRIQPFDFNSVNEKTKILQEAISTFDVTIFEANSYDKVKLLWGDVRDEFKNIEEINKIRRKYQLHPVNIDNLEDIDTIGWSKLLWLADKCPLILAEDSTVQKAIELCSKEKFILLGGDIMKEWMPNKSCFQYLADLKISSDIYEKLIDNVTCTVQGKQEVSLKFLVAHNPEVLQIVKTDNLLEMLDGPLNIGGDKENLPFPYIERLLLKFIIDIRYLEKVDQNTLTILYCVQNVDRLEDKLSHYNFINIERFLNEDTEDDSSSGEDSNAINLRTNYSSQISVENRDLEKPNIYVTEDEYTQDYFQKLCNRIKWTKKSHQFRYTEDGNLEWLQSNSEISNLENYRLLAPLLVQEETLWNTKPVNSINLILGDPGMGKTEILKNLKNNLPIDCWTVFIYPKDIDNFFKKLKYQTTDVRDFEKFVLEDKYSDLSRFDMEFLKIQMEENRVFFVWDALDEISNKHLESATNLILQFSKRNVVQWVTSRCHLKKYLEIKFNVLCMNMTQFNEEEQDFYIKNRLSDVNSAECIEEAIKKIKNTFAVVEHRDVLGIPLQLFMLTSLFRQNREKYLELLNNTFALTDLYQCFIEEKFNLYYEKKSDVNLQNSDLKMLIEVFKKVTLECYEGLALKTLLSEEYLKKLNVDVMKDLQTIQENNVAIGLVTDVTAQIPRFLHNSFAEYLAAVRFSKNLELKDTIADIIFDQKYVNVRFFFDLLLAKQSLPHIAVLYKDYSLLGKCGDEIKTCKDEGGRTLLHIACSWETTYPCLKVEKDNEAYVIDEESNSCVTKKETTNFNIIKYLAMNDQYLIQDTLFNMTPTTYAQKCHCLISVLEIMKNQNQPMPKICDEVAVNILFYSAVFGYDDAINIFMSNDLPFIETKNNKSSLLHLSVCHPTFVRKLLSVEKYKKAVNMTNKKKQTALYLASESEYKETVETLILHGAEVNLPDKNGNTPLLIASTNNCETIVEFLIKSGSKINLGNKNGTTPLYAASYKGHDKIVELLTTSGADVNLANKNGTTPLFIASQSGYEKIVEFLIKSGAKINQALRDGSTPLCVASLKGHLEIVEILVRSGAKVNLNNFNGFTPLHIASQNNNVKVVEFLIASDAIVNATAKGGYTPLSLASINGHEQIVEILIRSGSDVNFANKNGTTSLYMASLAGHHNVVKYLTESGAEVNLANTTGTTPLLIASQKGREKTVEILVGSGSDVNRSNDGGFTPLYAAAQNGRDKIVQFLVSSGAKVNLATQDGRTPLHIASLCGREKIVEFLVASGANVNLTDDEKYTPLHVASQKGYERIVEILVASGAGVNIADEDGFTPLDAALRNGHEKVAELLMASGATRSKKSVKKPKNIRKGCTVS